MLQSTHLIKPVTRYSMITINAIMISSSSGPGLYNDTLCSAGSVKYRNFKTNRYKTLSLCTYILYTNKCMYMYA